MNHPCLKSTHLKISNVLIIKHVSQGPPGPPEDVRVENISNTTLQLSWSPGTDNNSPIQIFTVQAQTPFSVGWQAVSTGKGHCVLGNCLRHMAYLCV